MLAIAVDLLTGRYGATAYNMRDEAEWPPHPGRLFAALVAAWGDAEEPDANERAVLRWLEEQQPPQLTCSLNHEIARRRPVTHYVPGNDPSADRATALDLLPENRNRQGRTFPSITPADTRVWFCWPEADPDSEQRAILDALASRVSRLGHSSTFVSCYLADSAPEPTLVPHTGDRVVLRVPGKGLLKALEREHARRGGCADRDRPSPRLEVEYGAPRRPATAVPTGMLSGDWIVLELSSVGKDVDRPSRVRNTRTLELARATRKALLERIDESMSPLVTGLWPDGSHRAHLAIVPLPAAGHRWADGTVHGVALMFPQDADTEQRTAVEQAIDDWRRDGFDLRLSSLDADLALQFTSARLAPRSGDQGHIDSSFALRRSRWCQQSRHWVSVTPVVLDRFVKGLHHRRADIAAAADSAAQAVIARSCVHIGLPKPDSVVVSPVGMTAGVPRAAGSHRLGQRTFPPFVAAGSGQRRQSVHAAVTFREEVRGPVLLGAGRYSGYGLFVPEQEAQGVRDDA